MVAAVEINIIAINTTAKVLMIKMFSFKSTHIQVVESKDSKDEVNKKRKEWWRKRFFDFDGKSNMQRGRNDGEKMK